MKNNLHGFTPINWSDQELSAYLHEKDKDWQHQIISRGRIAWTHFIANNVIVAIVKYQNSPTIDRWIWIPITETTTIFKDQTL